MNYQLWINQLKPDKKIRVYQHFDIPLNLDYEKHSKKVTDNISSIDNHQFLPFIKKVKKDVRYRIDKKRGKAVRSVKARPLMYASHLDSHIYSYYNFILTRKYEELLSKYNLSKNVIAYRRIHDEFLNKGKNNISFAKEVFNYIEEQDNCIVITQDIEKFFDRLDHWLLKKRLCEVLEMVNLDPDLYRIYRSLTQYKYIDHSDFVSKKVKQKLKKSKEPIYVILKEFLKENRSNRGIPQGSPISGLLANIYLFNFDKAIRDKFPTVFYRRYSDDLVFVCQYEEYTELLEFINKKIEEARLKINLKKSFISFFKKEATGKTICYEVTDGEKEKVGRHYVDYLGFEFDGANILFRKNTIQKIRRKQTKKIENFAFNSISPHRIKPKKNITATKKIKRNYMQRAIEIVEKESINKQALKIIKNRNKLKRIYSSKKAESKN